MSHDQPALPWLERVTAASLVAVLLALGWMLWAPSQPDEIEVIGVVALLLVALSLVSLVALLHTRSDQHTP